MKTLLNSALLVLFLLSAVSPAKLKLTKSEPKTVMATLRGYIRVNNTSTLIPKDKLDGNIRIIFTSEATKTIYSAKITADGIYEVVLPIGRYFREIISGKFKGKSAKVCVRSSATLGNSQHTIGLVAVVEPPKKPDARNKTDIIPDIKPTPPPTPKSTNISVSGYIKDSTNNQALNSTQGVLVTFVNSVTKQTYTATVLPGGIWEVLNIPRGNYTIHVLIKGYAEQSEVRTFSESSTEKNPRNVIFVSPEVKGYRIVLTWGEKPLDLDAHVRLPDGNEVNFDSRKSADGKVTLDVDARKGFGPETVTFNDPLAPGIYQYYVDKYSNEASLDKSKAKVVVYQGAKKVAELTVPQSGTVTDDWLVISINGKDGTYKIVNQYI